MPDGSELAHPMWHVDIGNGGLLSITEFNLSLINT